MAFQYEVTISESNGNRKLFKNSPVALSRNEIVKALRDACKAKGLSFDDYPIVVGIRGRRVA
jgi:hypothetical protein